MVKLTKSQLRFLIDANRFSLPSDYAVCCGSDGRIAIGQAMRAAKSLERLGLVKYICHDTTDDEDHSPDIEWPVYGITKFGRAVLDGTK